MHLRHAYSYDQRENYCYRCGNLLGRSRGFLYYRHRQRPTPARAIRSALARVKNAYREFTGYHERSCQQCGRDSTTDWNKHLPNAPPESLLGRVGTLFSVRAVRHTFDVTAGAPQGVLWASFPVRGLVGRPLGLELRSMSWETGRLGSSPRMIGLLYEAEGGPPRRRLLLEQAGGAGETVRMRSPERELRAIVEVVQEHGARGQRERYDDRGNVFRHWNLERLATARRRTVVMNTGGVSATVEYALWSDPQQVVLAHLHLHGTEVMAAAVDVPPARLLAMLKGLTRPRGASEIPPWNV